MDGLPLSGGTLGRVAPNASVQQQIAALNGIIDRLNSLLKSQVFSDGQTKRMIIGFQKDGWGPGKDFGMKVSVAGIDVTTATDSQLLFKMDLATWSYYDPETHENFMQSGILPDGSGGIVIVKPGVNVADVF